MGLFKIFEGARRFGQTFLWEWAGRVKLFCQKGGIGQTFLVKLGLTFEFDLDSF